MATLTVRCIGTRTLVHTARASRDAMTRTLARDAELEVSWPSEEGVLLGAFQRPSEHTGAERKLARGTPGCAVRVGRGTLHVLLALASPSALVACDESQILNRYVRPLLRALTKSGAPARYFGRDWISVNHAPAAHVGFAHSRATSRTVVEAFVAVRAPFDTYARSSYAGKVPITLNLDEANLPRLEEDIARAFGELAAETETATESESATEPESESESEMEPWTARVQEAIGPVYAGRDSHGRMRVGGEFMASFDAVRDLEDRLAPLGKSPPDDAIATAVQGAFDAPHTALFGVRSLNSFRAALASAYAHELE